MDLKRISVTLSYMLRHCKEPLYVSLDGGWASVEVIIDALSRKYLGVNRQILDEIVATDKKGRYSYDSTGERIRANQGHSIPNVSVKMESPAPPQYLYHGTASRFLPSILKEWLKPMSRQFVHISTDYDTAVMVGKRHGTPVVFVMRAADFVADGHELYRSSNGVWQAKAVPPEYLSVYDERQ